MTNVPTVFSRVVGGVLWEFQNDFAINFMDDILIYFDTHIEHIQKYLLNSMMRSHANPEKYTWCATSVFYLGHKISAKEFESLRKRYYLLPHGLLLRMLRNFVRSLVFNLIIENSLRDLH